LKAVSARHRNICGSGGSAGSGPWARKSVHADHCPVVEVQSAPPIILTEADLVAQRVEQRQLRAGEIIGWLPSRDL
jgi:hypothetical protein